jgi:hypothetical protein
MDELFAINTQDRQEDGRRRDVIPSGDGSKPFMLDGTSASLAVAIVLSSEEIYPVSQLPTGPWKTSSLCQRTNRRSGLPF